MFTDSLPVMTWNFYLIISEVLLAKLNVFINLFKCCKASFTIKCKEFLKWYILYSHGSLCIFSINLDITYLYREKGLAPHKSTSAVTTIVTSPFLSPKWQQKSCAQNRIPKCGSLPRCPIVLSVIL